MLLRRSNFLSNLLFDFRRDFLTVKKKYRFVCQTCYWHGYDYSQGFMTFFLMIFTEILVHLGLVLTKFLLILDRIDPISECLIQFSYQNLHTVFPFSSRSSAFTIRLIVRSILLSAFAIRRQYDPTEISISAITSS